MSQSERSEHSAKRVAQNAERFHFIFDFLVMLLLHPFVLFKIIKFAVSRVLLERAKIRHDNQQLVSWYRDNRD